VLTRCDRGLDSSGKVVALNNVDNTSDANKPIPTRYIDWPPSGKEPTITARDRRAVLARR
jgi:hypothetical protein